MYVNINYLVRFRHCSTMELRNNKLFALRGTRRGDVKAQRLRGFETQRPRDTEKAGSYSSDQKSSSKSSNPRSWGRDLCLPLTPSTGPAQLPAGGGAGVGGVKNHCKANEKSTFLAPDRPKTPQ